MDRNDAFLVAWVGKSNLIVGATMVYKLAGAVWLFLIGTWVWEHSLAQTQEQAQGLLLALVIVGKATCFFWLALYLCWPRKRPAPPQ